MTTPTGPISLAQQRARIMLADCATFRSWVGAANQTEALASIHLKSMATVPATAAAWIAARPLCVVDMPADNGYSTERVAGGLGACYVESGQIMLSFEAELADADDESDSRVVFENKLGAIFSEMWALSGTDGTTTVGETTAYLTIDQLELVLGPEGAADDEQATQSNYLLAIAILHWST